MNIGIYMFFLAIGIATANVKVQHNKKNRWLFLSISTIIVWILLVANREGDNITYLRHYEAHQHSNSDFLYILLTRLVAFCGLDFFAFKYIIVLVALLIWVNAQKNYVSNMNYVLLLYMISFVFMDSQVLRNFIAMSILVLSIRFLQNPQNKKNIIYFLICVLVAAGIHGAFIFYGLLLLILLRGRKSFAKILLGSSGGLTLLMYMNGRKIPFLKELASLFVTDYRISVFSTSTRWGAIPVVLIYIYTLWLLWVLDGRRQWNKHASQLNYSQLLIFINVCMAPALPLVVMNLNFYRLFKNVAILNYGFLANAYQQNTTVKGRIGIIAFSLILALAWFLFETQVFATFESVVEPVLLGYMFFEP